MILLNLTPHPINIHLPDKIETLQPFGVVPRIDNEQEEVGHINGIPLLYRRSLKTTNLPHPQQNVVYIVSNIVRMENAHRKDLVSPAGYLRDENDRVIGCTMLIGNE